jgi:hypothetical protein
MSSILAGAIFIPGTWLSYLLVRWMLTHFDLNIEDKAALSFLTALAYLVGHLTIAINFGRAERHQESDRRDE